MEDPPSTPLSSQSTESVYSIHRASTSQNFSDDETDLAVAQTPDAPQTKTVLDTSRQQGSHSDETTTSTITITTTTTGASTDSNSHQRGKKVKILPLHLPGPLPALPATAPLPDLEDFNLRREQLRNPLFVAISKVLIVYGNAWQSATDLVGYVHGTGNRSDQLGRTPKGTVQGAISTALALASALGTFEPIEKERMNATTYYRMATQVLDPASSDIESDSTMSVTSKGSSSQKASSVRRGKSREAKTPPPPSSSSQATEPPSLPIPSQQPDNLNKRRTPRSGWSSAGSMSPESSENEDDDNVQRGDHSRRKSSKRTRTRSPYEEDDSISYDFEGSPKLQAHDPDINQSSLVNLAIDPMQSEEQAQASSTVTVQESDFPDRRADFRLRMDVEPKMFAVEQQVGYTYVKQRTHERKRLPKADCEDGFAVSDLKFRGGYLGRLFCITDGHGGRACSSFVIATIPGAMQVILGKYKPTDLSLASVQDQIKTQITEAIRLMDKEYLDYKKQQYLLYKAKKIPNDPGSDGTTLSVNIFIGQWIININLGNTRSILGVREAPGQWKVDFSSEDHVPSLERLAVTIHANGGEFVTHDDTVIKFDPTLKNDKKHRQSLKGSRIRVKDAASNLYGIPYRTRSGQNASVHLGACVGDVLYKLDPARPVLSNKPDITFIDTSSIEPGFLLMASDGLWENVKKGAKVQEQNSAVCQYVVDKMERGWGFQRIVTTMSDREGETELYTDPIQEYTDITAILVGIGDVENVKVQLAVSDSEAASKSASASGLTTSLPTSPLPTDAEPTAGH
ncbi:hypothetical protein BGZ94_006664 [Podila epigama]|nr:hypothetical protein BGZ94_006664 [Podila epigama]